MPVFEHDGLRLHYAERGSGRPLVLVHGLFWSARMFGRLATGLEAGRAPLDVVSPFIRRIPVPAGVPEIAAFRDMAALEPRSGAALIRGLIADADRLDDLQHAGRLDIPTLVIGHR